MENEDACVPYGGVHDLWFAFLQHWLLVFLPFFSVSSLGLTPLPLYAGQTPLQGTPLSAGRAPVHLNCRLLCVCKSFTCRKCMPPPSCSPPPHSPRPERGSVCPAPTPEHRGPPIFRGSLGPNRPPVGSLPETCGAQSLLHQTTSTMCRDCASPISTDAAGMRSSHRGITRGGGSTDPFSPAYASPP